MKNHEYSFQDYANRILPKRMEMLESLVAHPFKVSNLLGEGSGERGAIKKIGRMDDFKGIYLFTKKEKVIYIGTSEKVINRIMYQIKGHTKYQAHLAWEIAKENNYWINKKLKVPNLDRAKSDVAKLQVAFMEITSPLERHLLELYAAMHYNCKFNFFESR